MITATDFFCGAGGSSTGLVAAGIEVRHAANHWQLAIETHNTNHPDTEHHLDDLQQAHASWFPRTDIAWFSPECTNHSLAKGRRRKAINQLDLWGETGVDPAEERSRATMREVVEFAEFHRYEAVIVENVVDIRHWQFFDEWMTAMLDLGYHAKILYLNSMFFGVPQSRDRFYAVFWRKGNHAPDLDFRPWANCPEHGHVQPVQVFKKEKHWGRYGARRQYVYRCPHCGADVMPQYRPAADVIDWTIPATKIGDRDKPLKEKTMNRILAGLRKFGHWPAIADLGHTQANDTDKVRSAAEPLATQTTRQTLALVRPFITSQHEGRDAVRGVDRELPCITTMNNEHQLVVPPFVTSLNHSTVRNVPVDEPLPTVMPQVTPALVQPIVMSYYGTNPTYATVDEPLPTMRTVQHEALITPEQMLPETGFRMLEPRELKLGMSFPDEYVILGNKRDQVRQIGNAVTANVAQWIAERVVESLAL